MRGASPNEQVLAAARNDNEELFREAIEGGADINCRDGAGDTPLHLAVKNGSTSVLEDILSHEECDVDPNNSLTGETPLHYAVKLEDPELRRHITESLLEAGADTTIKDKEGDTVVDILRPDDEIRDLFRKAQAQNKISSGDIAHDDDDDDDGSGSASE